MDVLLFESATKIFTAHRDAPDELWRVLAQNGLTQLWVSEAAGGFGLSPAVGFGLIRVAGYHAAPVPFAETLLASWLLGEAGIHMPDGPLSVVVEGWQRDVAFGAQAGHLVLVQGQNVSLHVGPATGTAETVGLDPVSPLPDWRVPPIASGLLVGTDAASFAALVRAAQICGALDAVLGLTIGFAEQREQFGRSLSKFQAIQHLLSEMAAEAAAASAALEAAVLKVIPGAPHDFLSVASAKYQAGRAAGVVAEHAHQVHGAIGYTHEYGLAKLTRRLWRWREDFGGEALWGEALGQALLSGSDPLWPRLTAGVLS